MNKEHIGIELPVKAQTVHLSFEAYIAFDSCPLIYLAYEL